MGLSLCQGLPGFAEYLARVCQTLRWFCGGGLRNGGLNALRLPPTLITAHYLIEAFPTGDPGCLDVPISKNIATV